MICRPEHYFDAALERHAQAQLLRRSCHYSLAVYTFGLSVECLLRAFQPASAVFDDRHNIVDLFRRADWEVSDKRRRRLHVAVSIIDEVWHNNLRFADEGRLRSHLKARQQDRGVSKNADFLKVRCEELDEACSEIIDIGRSTWRRPQ